MWCRTACSANKPYQRVFVFLNSINKKRESSLKNLIVCISSWADDGLATVRLYSPSMKNGLHGRQIRIGLIDEQQVYHRFWPLEAVVRSEFEVEKDNGEFPVFSNLLSTRFDLKPLGRREYFATLLLAANNWNKFEIIILS